MKKIKKPKYSNEELIQTAENDKKSTGGVVEYKGRLFYKKPLEKLMERIKKQKMN